MSLKPYSCSRFVVAMAKTSSEDRLAVVSAISCVKTFDQSDPSGRFYVSVMPNASEKTHIGQLPSRREDGGHGHRLVVTGPDGGRLQRF